MKRMVLLFAVISVIAASVSAAPFSPKLLKLSAPQNVQYDFNGKELSLPVTVSGTPANVVFLVFTKDRAASIQKVRNGYLGWHYMNKIDTCLYTSPPQQFEPGERTVVWDGRDENGIHIQPGDYTYYLWGFDNISPRTLMTRQVKMDSWIHRTVITHDIGGKPLAQPMVYIGGGTRSSSPDPVKQIHSKWIVGSDPEDATLLETTTSPGWSGLGGIALQPDDYRNYFYDTIRDSTKVTEKYAWVPNGASVLQTEWGKNGQFTYTGSWPRGWNFSPGVVSDGGDYLFVTTGDISGVSTRSDLIFIDVETGLERKRFDLTEWWIDPRDEAGGGQKTGGPVLLSFRDGVLAMGSHSSCLNQLMNPYAENVRDALIWSNGNGDYTGDHNFEPDSEKKWVCNDYNVGPYKYNMSMDANLFTVFPCFNYDFPFSFGLYAPDGTGMGYYAVARENAKGKYGVEFIDSGSSYDGLYTTNSDTPGESWTTIDPSWWFVAHDSIKGTIASSGPYLWVTSPNGGEVWGTGTPHAITWISSGVSTVKIEYSADNGSTWNLVAENVSGGSCSWTPGEIQSEQCLVRVTSVSDASLKGISQAPFTVISPFVKLTVPNGGEVWETGTAQTVSWTFFGVENVKIDYSLDKGSTWSLVSDVKAANRSCSWKVPDTAAEGCMVRVADAANASVSDMSDAPFQIKPGFIQVTAPNGGAEWEARQTMPIVWTASSGVSFVRIEFSSDNGTSWNTIADKVAASSGTYSWKIPDMSSPKCLVRVGDAGSTGLSDTSDGVFTIVPSTSKWRTYTTADGLGSNSIWTVVDDLAGGVWIGTGETWSGSGGISHFNGLTWSTYSTRNSGIAADNVYALAVDRDGIVWVGTTWKGLSRFDGKSWITYTKDNSTLPDNDIRDLIVDHDNVLWLTTWHGGVSSITGNTWKSFGAVPHGEILAIDTDNTLWVGYNFGDGGVSHYNGTSWKRYFRRDGLAGDYVLGIAVDQDGKKWFATSGGITTFDGTTWNTCNYLKGNHIQAVAIDHDGVKWFGYSGGVASYDGNEWKSYNTSNSELSSNDIWRIAVDVNNVKWFASRDKGISSFTSNSGPYVRVSSPNGGELWESGSAHEITWVSKDVERISIEYSLDDGATWNQLSGNTDASLKSYHWTLPRGKSFSCKVRLTDVSDGKHIDTSNGVFTISPPFVRVTSPNGGERWASGSAHPITWVTLGAGRVKLEYSVDGGGSWHLINTVDAASVAYPWTVPQVESADCRVRVTDADVPERTDIGDAAFTVLKPYITVTAPNGGESWTTGQMQAIAWDSDGVERVTLEFSVDSGLSWNRVAANVDAATHVYSWWPVGISTRLGLIRITDSALGNIADVSDAVFSTVQIVSVSERIPREFTVSPNSPNPFNPSTTITFTLPRSERVKVDVYNLAGQKVGAVLDSRMEPGKHSIIWNARGLSAGVYLGLVRAGSEVKTIKMLLLK